MKTTIYLIRHGQTKWNEEHKIQGRIDIPLNDRGIEQVTTTGHRLKEANLNFDVYLSSPLMRAKTSCEIIRNINGDNDKPIIIHQDLIEREFGEADGLTITDEVYDNILKNNYQGMESSSAINIRSTTELSNLVREFPGKCILVVTHSHFIKGIFTVLDKKITFKSLLYNGGICKITFDDDKIIEYEFNI